MFDNKNYPYDVRISAIHELLASINSTKQSLEVKRDYEQQRNQIVKINKPIQTGKTFTIQ